MTANDIETLTDEIYKKIFESEISGLHARLLESLNEHADENGLVGVDQQLQAMVPFVLIESTRLSIKVMVELLKKVLPVQESVLPTQQDK